MRIDTSRVVSRAWLRDPTQSRGDVKDGYQCSRFDGPTLTGGRFLSAALVWPQRRQFRAMVTAAPELPRRNSRSRLRPAAFRWLVRLIPTQTHGPITPAV